jgi:hypothetical protein
MIAEALRAQVRAEPAARAAPAEPPVSKQVRIEAREALAHVVDPVVRGVLEKIAEDETRHAKLAWAFAAWAVRQGGDAARQVVRAELVAAKLRAELVAAKLRAETRNIGIEAPAGSNLQRHGFIDAATRVALERETLARVVEPCARAALAGRSRVADSFSHRAAS